MRIKAILVLLQLFFIFGLFQCCRVKALAMDDSTAAQSPEEQAQVAADEWKIVVSDREPVRSGITCFSVDPSGRIAVGSSSRDRNQICIYNAEMNFLYAVSFSCEGSFRIVLTEDVVWAVLWRPDLCVGIRPDGMVSEVRPLQQSDKVLSNRGDSSAGTSLKVNGKTYELRNQRKLLNLTGKYSQIVVTNPDSSQEVLYNVEGKMMVQLIAVLVLICALLLLTIVCTWGRLTNHRGYR